MRSKNSRRSVSKRSRPLAAARRVTRAKATIDRSIEQDREVGASRALHELLEQGDVRHPETTARALVCVSRIGESIAEDPAAGLQRRLDEVREVHCPGSEHQQQFRERRQRLLTALEHDVAYPLGERRSAWFTRHDRIDANSSQRPRGMQNLRRFADAFDAFERHETGSVRVHCAVPADSRRRSFAR